MSTQILPLTTMPSVCDYIGVPDAWSGEGELEALHGRWFNIVSVLLSDRIFEEYCLPCGLPRDFADAVLFCVKKKSLWTVTATNYEDFYDAIVDRCLAELELFLQVLARMTNQEAIVAAML